MKPLLKIAGFWGAVVLGAWMYINSDVPQPPGVLIAGEPQQIYIVERTWERGDAHFSALAQFDIRARVLSANHYTFDRQADLSPVDLALGWGPMSDTAVLDDIKITQSGRYYFWGPRMGHSLPISRREIISHSANMHMIPADDKVKKTLRAVKKGELVTVAGFLVEVTRPNGWKWRTSLTRTDTGGGACELVWVDRISHYGTVMQQASR